MNRWTATIAKSGKTYALGYFAREEDAAQAYDVAAARFFGELARSNATLGLFAQPKVATPKDGIGGAAPSSRDGGRATGLSSHSRRDRGAFGSR